MLGKKSGPFTKVLHGLEHMPRYRLKEVDSAYFAGENRPLDGGVINTNSLLTRTKRQYVRVHEMKHLQEIEGTKKDRQRLRATYDYEHFRKARRYSDDPVVHALFRKMSKRRMPFSEVFDRTIFSINNNIVASREPFAYYTELKSRELTEMHQKEKWVNKIITDKLSAYPGAPIQIKIFKDIIRLDNALINLKNKYGNRLLSTSEVADIVTSFEKHALRDFAQKQNDLTLTLDKSNLPIFLDIIQQTKEKGDKPFTAVKHWILELNLLDHGQNSFMHSMFRR